jgi:5-methylcytosine-specific restriction protein A
MPLLYHWVRENYLHDLDHGVGYHLNQGAARLHEVDVGDSVWAFTRRADGGYGLSAELVVCRKTLNHAGYAYGPYRVWGSLEHSRYFRLDGQRDTEPVLRALTRQEKAPVLGRAFQGHAAVRQLTGADHAMLAAFSAGLPEEPRAKLLPEGLLEAAIEADHAEEMVETLLREPVGIAPPRRAQVLRYARDRRLVSDLRSLYDGACQICEWRPKPLYQSELCEVHHLNWLSRGGEDELHNLVLLCPNHHRAVHATDAQLDFRDLSFDFNGLREPLRMDSHLQNLRRA